MHCTNAISEPDQRTCSWTRASISCAQVKRRFSRLNAVPPTITLAPGDPSQLSYTCSKVLQPPSKGARANTSRFLKHMQPRPQTKLRSQNSSSSLPKTSLRSFCQTLSDFTAAFLRRAFQFDCSVSADDMAPFVALELCAHAHIGWHHSHLP
jgi:hypothetical protein